MATEPAVSDSAALTQAPIYFPVSITKLVCLSFCSFGIYEIYWFYKNWQLERDRKREQLNPFWRAVFAVLFCYSLFKRIMVTGVREALFKGGGAGLLATLYIISSISWKLPDPYSLISLLTVLPLVMAQQMAEKINAKVAHRQRHPASARWSTLPLRCRLRLRSEPVALMNPSQHALPNPRLQRTRLRAPLSRKPLGNRKLLRRCCSIVLSTALFIPFGACSQVAAPTQRAPAAAQSPDILFHVVLAGTRPPERLSGVEVSLVAGDGRIISVGKTVAGEIRLSKAKVREARATLILFCGESTFCGAVHVQQETSSIFDFDEYHLELAQLVAV